MSSLIYSVTVITSRAFSVVNSNWFLRSPYYTIIAFQWGRYGDWFIDLMKQYRPINDHIDRNWNATIANYYKFKMKFKIIILSKTVIYLYAWSYSTMSVFFTLVISFSLLQLATLHYNEALPDINTQWYTQIS
jgi:hypothetical protein